MEIKERLKKEVWRSDIYYQVAKKGSLDLTHPAMLVLKKLAASATNILDLGCGEGTRLFSIADNRIRSTGIDISKTAIDLAKKSYPKIKFIKADLENIPIEDESFDLVYSAYVLEHLTDPIKVLLEAIRLTSKKGFLILVAPNYGAPNRVSPPFRGSRLKKFVKGFINDLLIFSNETFSLNWDRVEPIASKDKYDIDWDTVIEPYIGSLIKFLQKQGMKIVEFNTCWSEELKNARFHQRVFRFLGEKLGIYPFSMWGPHLLIVSRKE